MFTQQPPAQVVLVPSGLNVHDCAARLQARVRDAAIPVVQPAPDHLALCFFAILEQVVQEQKVRTASRQAGTTSDREV